MSTLELNGKDFATQTSSAEPVLASTVTGGAGLSGSTSLGTVTSANLSNTAIVYPVGHVLQTVSEKAAIDIYSSTTSFTGGNDTLTSSPTLEVEITPLASSDILIIAQFPFYSGGNYGFADFTKYHSSGTQSYNLSGTANGMNVTGTNTFWHSVTMTYLDPCAEADATVKKYGLVARSSGSHNTHVGYSGINSQITVMEIKR